MRVGLVEHYSPSVGISGWAFDVEGVSEPLKLGLYVGEALAVTTIAAIPRPDVMESYPECSGFVGFRFLPLDFLSLAAIEGVSDDALVEVRILPEGAVLRSAVKMPTRFGALAACEAALAASNQASAGSPAYGSLIHRLRHFRRLAARTLPAARYTRTDGYIETVAEVGEGTVMLGGWLTGDPGHLLEGAGFLFSDDRTHCGLSLMAFAHRRPDLPKEARQFLAVAYGGWVPSPDSRLTGALLLASTSPLFMPVSNELLLVSPDVYDAQLRELGESCGEKVPPIIRQFRSLLYHAGEFGSSKDAGSVRCSLDVLIAVPGFGFLASGWMLLGREKLQTLEIRQGETLAPAVPGSLAFSPRPDLAEPYPGDNVDRAGFVVAFECPEGDVPRRGPLQLRMEFSGGRTYVMDVEPDQITTVQSVNDLAKIGEVFPDIDAEEFGPRIHAALTDFFRNTVEFLPVAAPKEVAESFLVLLLPADESLCRLHLACAGRLAHEMSGDIGICLLAAGAGARRSLRQWLLYEPNLARHVSAAFVVSDHFALHHIPRLLELLPMERLAFCAGPPIFEDDTRDALAAFLQRETDGPMAVISGTGEDMSLRLLATTRDRIDSYVAIAPYHFRGDDFTTLRVLGHRIVHDDAIELTAETRAEDFVDRLESMTDPLEGACVAY